MKTLFLIPPSEWKNSFSKYREEDLSFVFKKPLEIAKNADKKDLKCKQDRFKEAQYLNENIEKQKTIEAINRYSWVMYNSIDFENMSLKAKDFFLNNFVILSWMYGMLSPSDKIWNYKLPIDAKWLYKFWWETLIEKICKEKPDYIINLLPISYAKLLWLSTNCNRHKKKLEKIISSSIKIVNINFLKQDWKKISHWVKKIKWEWIKNICEKQIKDYKKFWWNIEEKSSIIDINIIN